jgi:hypothetical protein
MAGRRNRYSESAEVAALKEEVDSARRRSNNLAGSSSSMIASNAPYGLTVQGALAAESATFSSLVTVNNGLTVSTTSAAVVLPRMTTSQRNALTAAEGMIIFNTSDDKFQGYTGSTWVNLH